MARRVFWLEMSASIGAILAMSLFLLWHPLPASAMATVDNVAQVLLPLPLLGIVFLSFRRSWRSCSSFTMFWQIAKAPMLIVVAVICDLIGQSLWLYFAQILHNDLPSPSLADLAYLSTDPLLLVGILLIQTQPLTALERLHVVFDGCIILIALTTCSWYFILGPTLAQSDENILGKLVNTAYPICDLLLIVCLLLLMGRQTRNSLRSVVTSLIVGLGAIVLADVVYAYQTLQGTYITGEGIDVLWPLGDMCYLVAAHALLVRQLFRHTRRVPTTQSGSPSMRVALLPYLLLPAIGLLVWYLRTQQHEPFLDNGVYLGAAVLLLLVVIRQLITFHELRQHLRQEQLLLREIQQAHDDLHERHGALLLANAELTGLRDTLSQQNIELRGANAQLSALAITDPLTGLHNHRFFQEILGKELAAAASQSLPVALLMLDIDHFRQFNEGYGHDAGDRVLKIVAQAIHEAIRAKDHAARYGGEEMVIILPGADETQARDIADRLRIAIEQTPLVIDHEVARITVSIGYACFPWHASAAQSLLKAADLALYAAKRQGRNRVCAYTPLLFEQHMPVFSSSMPLSLPSGADWETIQALITAIDLRDGYTAAHSEGVARNAVAIGTALGLSAEQIETLRLGGLVHDVGKIGVPDDILRKPGRLTPEEWQIMQAHTTMGEQILRSVESLHHLIPLVRSHHERLDGSGYPDGLRGNMIPLLVRIMSVADIFDAYTGERPYHAGRTAQEGLVLLQQEARMERLDQKIVNLFVTLIEQQLSLVGEDLKKAA